MEKEERNVFLNPFQGETIKIYEISSDGEYRIKKKQSGYFDDVLHLNLDSNEKFFDLSIDESLNNSLLSQQITNK